jgi:hypothetical protein
MSFLHNIHTSSGTHPDLHSTGTSAISLEVKQPGCEYNHTPVHTAKLKKSGAVPLLPLYIFMTWVGIILPLSKC